jgi:hypothetical protein
MIILPIRAWAQITNPTIPMKNMFLEIPSKVLNSSLLKELGKNKNNKKNNIFFF